MYMEQRGGWGRPKRSSRTGRRRRFRPSPTVLAAAYVVLLALFGGGPAAWTPAYMVLTLVILVAATGLAWTGGLAALRRIPPLGQTALIGIAVLPLLQLVPLPPFLWQSLPGQALRRDTLALVGAADSWQPFTLNPVDTGMAAILAIGFPVLVLILMRLDDRGFARVLDTALVTVLAGIGFGVLQVVSDGAFPRFHPVNTGATMLGFYANKNHMGLVIACAMALFGFVAARRIRDPRRRRAAVIGFVLFTLVCVVTTNSRAALGFAALAAAIVLADATRTIAWRYRLLALAAVAVLAIAVLSSTAFETVSGRIGDVNDDLRWQIMQWSWPLVERFWLLGSGAASFVPLFNAGEQLEWVKPTYVNAVHNDYVQLLIEFGVPGVLLLVLFITSLWRPLAAWRSLAERDPLRGQLAFGLTVVVMFALHSFVDYPLRRPACWVFLGLALAALYRTQREIGPGGKAEKMEPA